MPLVKLPETKAPKHCTSLRRRTAACKAAKLVIITECVSVMMHFVIMASFRVPPAKLPEKEVLKPDFYDLVTSQHQVWALQDAACVHAHARHMPPVMHCHSLLCKYNPVEWCVVL